MSPSWPRALRSAWRALAAWSAHIPVGHGPTGSSGRPSALIATLSSPDREIVLLRLMAAATAQGTAPATRVRVVLLPHAHTEPTDTRPHHHRTAKANGMNHDGSPRQHPTPSATTLEIAASTQWHDAELAMKVARHSFDRWLVASHEDTPSPALMHAYHTHTALQEAARVTAGLIETFRIEAAALITTPAQGTGIPTQHR